MHYLLYQTRITILFLKITPFILNSYYIKMTPFTPLLLFFAKILHYLLYQTRIIIYGCFAIADYSLYKQITINFYQLNLKYYL